MVDVGSAKVGGDKKGRDSVSATPAKGLPLELIERQFDRVQALFPRIDSKINAIFAIVSGQIALASLALSDENWRHWDILVPAALFIVAIGAALYDLYRCTFPHVRRGSKSLVYFAEFASLAQGDALRAFTETDVEEYRRDLIVQTWRTSIIAAEKFRYLRRATFSALVSLLPWFWLLAASSWAVKP
jgi:hypothetical protein